MLGFETIGNATITVFDNVPVLTTDPWIFGKPYFGSWSHKYSIPKAQRDNINNSKFVWLSHGHPDHIDPDSLHILNNKKVLIADHYGDRIFNELSKKFSCIKIKSNQLFNIPDKVRIKSFADWNQDSSLLIEINKKDIIFNLNDGKAKGWSSTIKKEIQNYKNRFLLKLINWGDADMINIYDDNDKLILPHAAKKKPNGKNYAKEMKIWGCNFSIPFSSFHQYCRQDSIKMNEFVTPLEEHYTGFKNDVDEMLPAFIIWDSEKEDYKTINPDQNKIVKTNSEEYGDNWNDDLNEDDKKIIEKYFNEFDQLKKKFGFVGFKVGNSELNIKLSDRKEGVIFHTPRNSLIFSLKNKIFDDLIIGNFMKTKLIDVPSLYPDFSPYVAKYGDNGFAKSSKELKKYFDYYKFNSADYWKDFLGIKSEEIIRSSLKGNKFLYNLAKKIKQKFY